MLGEKKNNTPLFFSVLVTAHPSGSLFAVGVERRDLIAGSTARGFGAKKRKDSHKDPSVEMHETESQEVGGRATVPRQIMKHNYQICSSPLGCLPPLRR